MIGKVFKKDHLAFGAMIGAIAPVIIYSLLELITYKSNGINLQVFDQKTKLVLAVAVNILPFRLYMVKLKFEQTAKGILLVTFIYALAYIYISLN